MKPIDDKLDRYELACSAAYGSRPPVILHKRRDQHTPWMAFRPMFWVALLLGGLMLSGCNCKQDPGTGNGPPPECSSDQDCIDAHDSRWYCRNGECIKGERNCEDEGDVACCPGQTCSRHGVCLDRYDTCEVDADCDVAGQRCLPRIVNNNEQTVCTFALCENGACPDDLVCFAGFCIGENPCDGGCPHGEACAPSNNRCHPAPTCEPTCPEGSILAFGDPLNVDDDCDLDSLFCVCEPLPPLIPRDTGRHSAITYLPDGTLAVSAYNGDYGDLVVVYFDSSGTHLGTDWVDGVPAGAPAVANPTGPRGGVEEPGPDVGRYTGIVAANDGTLHVSYFDVSSQRLKYARRTDGEWTNHVVDEEGDVGRYSTIALDGAGVPYIAYFRRRGVDDDRYATALKVAQANGIAPYGSSDWTTIEVQRSVVSPTPCDGGCPSGQHCVSDGSDTVCLPSVSGCGGCPEGQVCVDLGSGPTCRSRLSTLSMDDLPVGIGLFPSLVIAADGTATVVFYDRRFTRLRIALGIDPRAEETGHRRILHSVFRSDIGRFPSAALDSSGDLIVSYQHADHGHLLWAKVDPEGNVVDSGVIDDGARDAIESLRLVGNDSSLVIAPDGRWMVAYQDGTTGDLVVAIREGDSWRKEVIASDGAAGFWADAVYGGGRLYVSHATVQAFPNAPLRTDLRLEVVNP